MVDRRATDGVAARRIAAVGPVEDAVRQIEFEIDGFRQPVEQQLDVGAVRRGLALWDLDAGAEDAAQAGVVRPLLRPVDLPSLRIEGDADAPAGLVAPVLVAAARLDQRLDLRAVEVGAHDAHAFAVGPVELAAGLIEVDLFRRMRDAGWDDDPAVFAVEVGPLDRTVVPADGPHVGPVDMAGLRIDDDAVGKPAIGDEGRAIGPVGIHGVDAPPAEIEEEQSAGSGDAR
jgi:hypothetical protein